MSALRKQIGFCLLLYVGVVVSVAANANEAARHRIEPQAKSIDVNAAKEIAVSYVSDKEQSPGAPSVMREKFRGVCELGREISDFGVRPVFGSEASSREFPTALSDGINGVGHTPRCSGQPFDFSIDQQSGGSAIIDGFPSGAVRPKEDKIAVDVEGNPRLRNIDRDVGSFQLDQSPLCNVSGSSSQVGLARSCISKNNCEARKGSCGESIDILAKRIKPTPNISEEDRETAGGAVICIFFGLWVWAIIVVTAPLGPNAGSRDENENQDGKSEK